MNRLQRECLAASLILHTLLLLVLVVGAGFVSAPRPTEEVALLTFIPDRLVDSPTMGGGSPSSQPAAAPRTLPAAQPQAVKPSPPPPAELERRQSPPQTPPRERVPAPSREREKPPKPADDAPAETSPHGERPAPKRTIEPNLNPVTRSPNSAKADRERSDAQARALAEAQRLADIREQRVNRLVTGLQQGLSGSTAVSVPGTGGPTYASYTSFVDLVYRSAWAPLKPRELSERSASVLVRVIIARDGTVLSSQIRRRSGHAALDSSVRTVLDRVRTIGRPFPEGARDTQREFEIEFNLQTAVGPG